VRYFHCQVHELGSGDPRELWCGLRVSDCIVASDSEVRTAFSTSSKVGLGRRCVLGVSHLGH